MSRDGYLPDDVTESMIPGNRPGDEHDKACPQHEDAPELCECGHPMSDPPHIFDAMSERIFGACLERLPTGAVCLCQEAALGYRECVCDAIIAQRESDRAEAAYESRREGI